MTTGYVFFDTDLRDRFVQALVARALACTTREDPMEGFVVELAEDPPDEVLEAIEADYEALMQEQMLRAEERPDWVSHRVAGVPITLSDGRAAVVRLPPPVARTLMERYSAGEAQDLVAAIAHSLENPIDGPLCRKK